MIAKGKLLLINSLNLLNLSSKKKRVLFLTLLIITFLLSSTIANAPGSNASEIHDKLKPTSDRSLDRSLFPSKTEKFNKEKDEYLNRGDEGSALKVPSFNVELVGMWPYGACETLAMATSRNMALIGNGYALQVLDISTPSSLSKIGEVELAGHVQDIAISGNYAYVVTDSYLKIIDISDLNSPFEVGSVHYDGFSFQSLALSSGYAYVAASNHGLIIYDVSDPNNPTFQANYYHEDLFVSDVAIWGNYAICEYQYQPPDTSSADYPHGVEVIDVSNILAPFLKGAYQTEDSYYLQGMDVSGDGYVFTCQYSDIDKTGKMIVVDVATDPENPTEVGSYVESERDFEGVTLSDNFAYLHDNRQSRLVTLDISTPSSPSYFGECDANGDCYDLEISGSFVGISHANCFSLYDVSNPGSPSQLGSYRTPDSLGKSMVVSGGYAYIAYRERGLCVMDVSDPSNPTVVGTCDNVRTGGGVAVSGRFAYCVGGWNRPYIVDISSPNNPFQASSLDFPSDADYGLHGVAVRGDYAYVSGNKWISGNPWVFLAVVDVSDPINPRIISTYVCSVITFNTGGVAVSDNYAYLPMENWSQVGDWRKSLRIIDISDPTDPTEVGSCFFNDYVSDIAVRGDYAYLPGGVFRIIDVSNPENPEEIFSSDWRWAANGVALSGDYAYLGNLRIVDISDPFNPQYAGQYYGEGGEGIAVSGNYAYVPGSLCVIKNLLAPEISIIDPSAWETLHGFVSIEALASHSSGIDKVEFYIDDSISSFDTTSPYAWSWDTSSVADGLHRIKALAYNNSGKTSDSEIEVRVRNNWSLTVSSSSGGTTDPDPETYSYNHGTEIFLTALPDNGYRFTDWTGDVPEGHENDNPLTITMDSDRSITANFIKQHTLTLSAGTGGTTYPASGNYPYDEGEEVSLAAIPGSGYRFSGWSGDASGLSNSITITMDSDKSVTASFVAISTDEGAAEEKKGPCFIATAAYGSPLHPGVELLRDFRDKYLMPTKLGRLLVGFYYRYSPFVAELIAKHKALKVVVRVSLLPLVAFSYSFLHFGPIITAAMSLVIFGFPVFFILFFRGKWRQKEKKEMGELS